MRFLAVINPSAGAGRCGSTWPRIAALLEGSGVTLDARLTNGPGHAAELVAAADFSGFDGLLAVGGDGTLFECVNGLYQRKRADRVPLGVIPVGTGNAFARDLGLGPNDWKSAVEKLLAARVRRVDVGRVTTPDDRYHFLNIIGMGFPVAAAQTARRLKVLGNGAYTLATLWEVLRLKSYHLVLEIDGRCFDEDNIFVEVANSRYTGTHFQIAPDAQLDDGLFDVVLLRSLSRRRILRLFPTIYSGRHVAFEEVEVLRARAIRLVAPEEMPLTVDGEFRGQTPALIECLEQDLDLLA